MLLAIWALAVLAAAVSCEEAVLESRTLGVTAGPDACTSGHVQAVRALTGRVLGQDAAAHFTFSCTACPTGKCSFFEISPSRALEPIKIAGTSGVALASGLHWYLKYTCSMSLLYGRIPLVPEGAVPSVWPQVEQRVQMRSPVTWQYYMNVVTHSYSAAWWSWERWQAEIDWMAMMGINMPLAFTGQEYVWNRVYRERFNLTQVDMDEHFAGPAFLAWGRMGNIRGWGGTYDSAGVTGLTTNWMERQRELQKQIVKRERSLGMVTVLPGFAGHVPLALGKRHPDAKMLRSGSWCGFTERYSMDGLLDPGDPLFRAIGSAFLEVQKEEFGSDGIFNGDTFNEVSGGGNITMWGSAVYDAMAAVEPGAVWFVQAWSLNHWDASKLDAYFADVPTDRLLGLDLGCATSDSSFLKFTTALSPARPVICGLLDDMGGRRSLSGNLHVLANQTIANVQSVGPALLTGIGWNPEDLHANPVKWQLMGEVGWRDDTNLIADIGQWIDGYAVRRYAPVRGTPSLRKAWRLLLDSAYGGGEHEHTYFRSETGSNEVDDSRPAAGGKSTPGLAQLAQKFSKNGFCRIPSWDLTLYRSRNQSGVVEAWRLLTQAVLEDDKLAKAPAYLYDIVDVGRQALQDRFADLFSEMVLGCTPTPLAGEGAWVAHNRSNCAGTCLPRDDSGSCDRMPGCGHDRRLPFCDVTSMKARCLNASNYKGVTCTMFNTNGYLYSGNRTTSFSQYPLACYTWKGQGPWGTPKCTNAIETIGTRILDLGRDLERLLSTDEHFLLGPWIAAARAWGNSTAERDWLEWNARIQVTLWGSTEANNGKISDYASKQWSGLVGGYHLPLWEHFLQRMGAASKAGSAIAPADEVMGEIVAKAEAWVNSTVPSYPASVSGEDPVIVSRTLYEKYFGTGRVGCASDGDCFGGVCKQSACVCPPSWDGPNCEVLRLRPARASSAGLMLLDKSTSTYGGGVVQQPNGTWHIFATHIASNCGLDAWWPNSDIVHARSIGGPDGPYEVIDTVLSNFSCGPKVLLRNGSMVLLHIGCGDSSTPLVRGCTNGSTPANWIRPSKRSRCNQPGWTGVMRATTVNGPWHQTEDTAGHGLSVESGPGAWHMSGGITNPSVWSYNDTNTVLAYSEDCANCSVDPGHKHVGVALGTLDVPLAGESAAFVDLTPLQPVFPWATEDPSIFRDPDSGYWHILAHRTSSTAGGGPTGAAISSHAVAASPYGPWKLAAVPPYSRDITWEDGSKTHAQKRERPQIIVDQSGTMVALSNGVRPGNAATPFSPQGFTGDWTYTHIQLIDRAKS